MKTFRLLITLSIALGSSLPCAGAGLPVFDPMNYYKNAVTSIQTVEMAKTLIKQYQTQLKQYENMQINSAMPLRQIWQDANATIQQLQGAMNTLTYYKKQLGSLEAYLGKFSDSKSYQTSPCFSGQGCSEANWQELSNSLELGSASRKKAVDAMIRSLDLQHASLQDSATNLGTLQAGATEIRGQLEALSYANQFASQMAAELIQIRSLLIAQQGLMAAHHQDRVNREAQQAAASTQFWSAPFQTHLGSRK